MRPLRWLGAGLVWIVAGVVGLLGVVLSVTVILLPLGIPLLMLARRLYSVASMLVVPRAVRHPVDELSKKGSKLGREAGKTLADASPTKPKRRFGRKRKSKGTRFLEWVLS